MKQNIRKVSKLALMGYKKRAVKRGRIHRFSKWIEQRYGIPWRTTYCKVREGRIKAGEGAGIEKCIREYGFKGSPKELWMSCTKNHFCDFMETKQMSRMTVWRRFSANDFSELEMNGISATYRHWRENIDSIN